MDAPIDATTVPGDRGEPHIAYVIFARAGDWAIGSTASAGTEGPGYPPSLSQRTLTWLGDGPMYGRNFPNLAEKDLPEALALVQSVTVREIIEADQGVRGSGITLLRKLAEIANQRQPADRRREPRIDTGELLRQKIEAALPAEEEE